MRLLKKDLWICTIKEVVKINNLVKLKLKLAVNIIYLQIKHILYKHTNIFCTTIYTYTTNKCTIGGRRKTDTCIFYIVQLYPLLGEKHILFPYKISRAF